MIRFRSGCTCTSFALCPACTEHIRKASEEATQGLRVLVDMGMPVLHHTYDAHGRNRRVVDVHDERLTSTIASRALAQED